MPTGITGGLKKPQSPIFKMAMKNAGIINTYFLHLTAGLVYPFFNKSFGNSGYIHNCTVEPHSSIYTMRKQIACYAATSRICIKPP